MAISGILWIVLVIVLAVWLIGLVTRVAGGFINLLLIVAVAILAYNLLSGRRNL
ncbi:MAG: lmo0937 family membrane protein [Chloroflexota bacterium]|nr:lmo0937 family membrane protein [Chloroflexota bacterium]